MRAHSELTQARKQAAVQFLQLVVAGRIDGRRGGTFFSICSIAEVRKITSNVPSAPSKGCACHSHGQVWSPKESRFRGIGCDCFAF